MSEKLSNCKTPNGVGTRLAEIIPTWAVANSSGCQCKRFECIMNGWGVERCREQRFLISEHLVKQAAHLIPALAHLPKTAHRLMAKALVNRAIANEVDRLERLDESEATEA